MIGIIPLTIHRTAVHASSDVFVRVMHCVANCIIVDSCVSLLAAFWRSCRCVTTFIFHFCSELTELAQQSRRQWCVVSGGAGHSPFLWQARQPPYMAMWQKDPMFCAAFRKLPSCCGPPGMLPVRRPRVIRAWLRAWYIPHSSVRFGASSSV